MKRFAHACTFLAALALLTGCGSSSEPPKSGDDADTSGSDTEPGKDTAGSSSSGSDSSGGGETAAEKEEGIPTKCAKEGDVCFPHKDFVKALCAYDYPTVALAMFQNGTPWTRAYTAGEVRAWNASGGGASNEKVPRDEELIVVTARTAPKGGMQISGVGDSYDMLRWDGSCITLDKGELRFDPPAKPKNARIIWKRLEVHVRDVLKEEEALRPKYLKHRKECKGVSMGTVSKKCVKADKELSEAVAAFVRENGGVPAPKKMPEL